MRAIYTTILHLELCSVLPPPSSLCCTCTLLSTSPSPEKVKVRFTYIAHTTCSGAVVWSQLQQVKISLPGVVLWSILLPRLCGWDIYFDRRGIGCEQVDPSNDVRHDIYTTIA